MQSAAMGVVSVAPPRTGWMLTIFLQVEKHKNKTKNLFETTVLLLGIREHQLVFQAVDLRTQLWLPQGAVTDINPPSVFFFRAAIVAVIFLFLPACRKHTCVLCLEGQCEAAVSNQQVKSEIRSKPACIDLSFRVGLQVRTVGSLRGSRPIIYLDGQVQSLRVSSPVRAASLLPRRGLSIIHLVAGQYGCWRHALIVGSLVAGLLWK